MTTPTEQCPTDDLNTLIVSKSSIEDEIESQATILRANNSTLDSPLTDGDGFPRADIDIWAVRHARVRIIRLRNDLSSLVDKIAMALERVYTSRSAGAEADAETSLSSLLPFARVDAVAPHGPAQLAGLRPGDLIIKFGPLTAGNVNGSLQSVAQQVERSENRPILLSVSRDNQIISMRLTPQRGWGGRGMVGCVTFFFPWPTLDRKPGVISYYTQHFRNHRSETSIMSPSSTSASPISTSLLSLSPSTTSLGPEAIMTLRLPRFRPLVLVSYSRYSLARPALLRYALTIAPHFVWGRTVNTMPFGVFTERSVSLKVSSAVSPIPPVSELSSPLSSPSPVVARDSEEAPNRLSLRSS
ncbi:hypothetical protein BDM02DRAFT_3090907 [Thelephora ganbajun]|uniref:Uncharacterized protein n=1 Tax=Thelephora ganbajun TaxID=370292 RepID=A0ACB6ZQZ1_THEGA|nr:hypothetical protein BDM02DRAFT_3090907 [Thelephora ganbajun]